VRLSPLCIANVILFALLAGCVGPPPDYWLSYSYNVQIYSENNSVQYQILLPIPINDFNETEPEFFNNIVTIEGNFSHGINQTIYGASLAIVGTGDIELTIEFDEESGDPIEGYPDLSMLDEFHQNEEIGIYWTFADSENITIHLTYLYSQFGPENDNIDREYIIISTLQSGWQRVPATIENWQTIE
jgi:hypothetical protein